MAATYTLISSNVLSSSAASVTFSAIPSTYTDLVLRISARGSNASTRTDVGITYNSSATGYSETEVYGTSTAAASAFNSYTTSNFVGNVSGASATANTFGSVEIYIPSYTATQKKCASAFAVSENNASTNLSAMIQATAMLWQTTSAITSIDIAAIGTTFVSGSSFYLYGIKNS